ncbi:MAG: response regulator, partial [Bacteroidota bacterium]
TDLMMPEMDGIELLKKIRKQTSHIPVIFLSAYNEPDKIKEALRQGADDYLFKPMSFNKIINSVKRSLSSATLL